MKPILTALLIAALSTPAAAECLVRADGIGGIRLGQTPAQVKQQFPRARFERTGDGEGVGYIVITLPGNTEITAYQAGEDADSESPINYRAKITALDTSSPACHTASGLRPGMSLQNAAGKLGRVKEILQDDEAREFASFQSQPGWLTIHVENAGRYLPYREGLPRSTPRYRPNGKILTLSVGRQSNR